MPILHELLFPPKLYLKQYMDCSVTSRTQFASVTSLLKEVLRLSLIGRALEEIGMVSHLVMISSRAIQTTISSEVEKRVDKKVDSKSGETDSLGFNRVVYTV